MPDNKDEKLDLNGELKNLLVQNLAETKIMREEMNHIKSYMKMRTIVSVIWIVAVILPTILAFLYIPTFIHELTGGTSTDLTKMLQGLQ